MTLLKGQPLLTCAACLALVAVAYFFVQNHQNQKLAPSDAVTEKSSALDQPQHAASAQSTISTKLGGEQKGSSVKKAGQVLREGGKANRVVCENCGGNHHVHREIPESLRKSLSRLSSHLIEVQLEDGGTAIDLGGGFHHASTASVNAEGEIEIHCSTSIEEILTIPTVNHSPDRDTPPVVENTVR